MIGVILAVTCGILLISTIGLAFELRETGAIADDAMDQLFVGREDIRDRDQRIDELTGLLLDERRTTRTQADLIGFLYTGKLCAVPAPCAHPSVGESI